MSVDAIVIGAGPNGLVAANVLADAGWDVVVLEAESEPGGAVKTAEVTLPGYRHDLFSSSYPLAVASPAMRAMNLHEHGLRWCHAPLVVAHPHTEEPCAFISRDLEETAGSLDAFAAGDGDAWRRLYALWERTGDALLDVLATPLPPVRAGARLAARLGARGLARFSRFAALPVRRLAEEEFSGRGGGRLLAGNALHADFAPESVGSGVYGWLLASLGQQHGFPVPRGGAGQLTRALVERLAVRGGRVECDARVAQIVVRRGRAVAVRTDDGRDVGARHAVLADVGAPALYEQLVGAAELTAGLRDDVRRFQYGPSTFKVDWALSGPVPWSSDEARRAGTVHVAEDMDTLTTWAAQLARRQIPERPYLVFGQYAAADPTRMPDGCEVAWAYTHVPQRTAGDAAGELRGDWDDVDERDRMAQRVEEQIERLAPGFRARIRARHVLSPTDLERADANLVGGAINGGTAQLHQQLALRPVPGLGRPGAGIRGLYLASASAHPGGGVHGACGANAARAALARQRARRLSVAVGGAAAAGALVGRLRA